ncbi:MAG TPA: hypothetical protein VFF34_02525 [Candidatus Nitrosocosmicus sp.]|nr:hypothetical protein [Candidatus Nitrosocosmicus sp.]
MSMTAHAMETPPASLTASVAERARAALVTRYGTAHADLIARGVAQVAERWWPEDGNEDEFVAFCSESWIDSDAERGAAFDRLEQAMEQVDGHLHEVRRELQRPIHLDLGPVRPVDLFLQNLDLGSHVEEDLFRTKTAFFALLHFPVDTLAERLDQGRSWDRRRWARSRFMDRFAERIPSSLIQKMGQVMREADLYIAEYNIHMDRLRTKDGRRPFPEGLRLISHWGLRDELKGRYVEGKDGQEKQRMIQTVMERIVRQEIPASVRDNPDVEWCPETNEVVPNGDRSSREPDTRYAYLLEVFHALKLADPYTPTAPTFVRRRFDLDRQIPEAEVRALLEAVLGSNEVRELARRIESRLGRPLEPFDVWYSGFSPREATSEEELDRVVRDRYPTLEAFQADLPRVLEKLGFAGDRALWLAERIVVDPARGPGHAMGAARRGDQSHLRTRAHNGMSYQTFNVAMHELGHCVEQVFSLDAIDHWSLSGVPNTAFTEAFAFTFQERDLEILGYGEKGEESRARDVLQSLWSTYEICGVSLIDMDVWNWLYAHPGATPGELREAVVAIARSVWNRWFAPVLGRKDSDLLAIYSHIIDSALYTPDYAIGKIVAFQVAPALRGPAFAEGVERMTRQGRLTPDAWMRGATGEGVSAGPLLAEARAALDRTS